MLSSFSDSWDRKGTSLFADKKFLQTTLFGFSICSPSVLLCIQDQIGFSLVRATIWACIQLAQDTVIEPASISPSILLPLLVLLDSSPKEDMNEGNYMILPE